MLGFACICKSLGNNGRFKATTIKYLSKLDKDSQIKKLRSIAVDNLYNTYKILQWCASNNILLYRMSSNLIPLATYYNQWHWWEDADIIKQCSNIKKLVKNKNIRISMHPDQFCVLNSDKSEVVANSIKILEYHNLLSNLTGNKLMILHVGSSAGGKETAIERFKSNFMLLDKDIKNKLSLENDDKKFTVLEVLTLCEQLKIPMILDMHHHRCCNQGEDLEALRNRIINTWKNKKPKLHISSGRSSELDRSHADFITIEDYHNAVEFAKDDFDIMFECKEKDMALLPFINNKI